ncbi:NDMA-dependent alcohol dehydrogenase [Trujillonella endophytica]|uniref:S-(Hydroxymethyl)glutathione dehydrogenase / alcohol dehydrogenase n=1 Tax=Trujillonella endophytica TaxID=673521 RepID=A0A1H8T7S5_9ACTN|nr:NDMA-dependent alcohol dehydrogenase [Trujillella endophytica]SEO86624.1 S-(hydroxymethyl)glutathione dehydrogenase / alcohol dehydrogenase [Trujillella endophytica]
MKTRAAILRSTPGTFEVVDVDLDDEPRDNEVLVQMVAAGLCHSDDHICTGDMPVEVYPVIGGHEGAGVVQRVGSGVRHLVPGDHVVFSFMPACGRCRFCARGQQNLCRLGATILTGSRPEDPTSFRVSLDGARVGQYSGLGAFAEHTLVDARSCVKVPDDAPLDKVCLLGCAVGTGWGSAVNSAGVRVGDTVIVMGVGGIGVNAVQGAACAGAGAVIAVDPVPFKREVASRLGATHAVATIAEAAELARSSTDGQGADSTIVAVGVTTGEHVAEGFASIRKGGTLVVTGIGNVAEHASIPLWQLTLFQKRIQGSLFGGCSATVDVPLQVELYRSGRLRLDELITTTYTLDQVAQGYEDMHAGRNIRGVIRFD